MASKSEMYENNKGEETTKLSSMETRSGLTPNEDGLPFKISTIDVEVYLQKKLDELIRRMNQANGTNIEPVKIQVLTTQAGGNFLPFIVILPMDVLEKEGKKNGKGGCEPSIFNPSRESRSIKMYRPYWEFFKSYLFNDDDTKSFFSDNWRRLVKVQRNTSMVLKTMATPRIQSINRGKDSSKAVTFMIDPLRVFYDMVYMPGLKYNYRVNITGFNKIKYGNYNYYVTREVIKKNDKKYSNTVLEEIERKIRNGQR